MILFVTVILTGFVVGFGSGVDGNRPPVTSHVAVLVIVLTVFVIIDLDHPRRGLNEVPRDSLIDLQATIQAEGES